MPRWPWIACWTRRRHRSSASPASRTTWNGSITATASGSSSVVAVLEARKPVHRDDLDTVAPRLRSVIEPLLERLLGAALDHVEQPCGACAVTDTGQVDDHGDVLVATPSVAPHVLVDADRGDVVEAMLVVDQDPLASARTASLAVFHATPRPSATRATLRC